MPKSRLTVIVLLVTTAIAVLAAGSAPASARSIEYGVSSQTHLNAGDYAKMRSGGVGLIRVLAIWPDGVKPAPGVSNYDFTGLDQLIGDAARHRIRALPYIVGDESWVPRGSGSRPPPGRTSSPPWSSATEATAPSGAHIPTSQASR